MSDRSAIAWTDATWNPVRGCTKVSAGCKHCYAERFAERFRGVKGHPFEQGFDVRLVPDALDLPLHWRKSRRIFVNSMSDLFHEDVPTHFIRQIFEVMAAAHQHTFQVLTKRPARMAELLPVLHAAGVHRSGVHRSGYGSGHLERPWPLPNVWLGVSVENQAAAAERIPELLATPAAVRFVSVEPLLGPVDLRDALIQTCCRRPDLAPADGCAGPGCNGTRLDWVIVGGESGPGSRPCEVTWIRSIVGQCRAARVPVFCKQLGANVHDRNDAGFDGDYPTAWPRIIGENDWIEHLEEGYQGAPVRIHLRDRKGGDMAEWPVDLRVREFPEVRRG